MSNDSLDDIGLKVGNYKCFGKTPQGFERILPFNVIIGRNNVGKSALLDVLDYIVTRQSKELLIMDDLRAAVVLGGKIDATDLERIVQDWGAPASIIGRRIEWSIEAEGNQNLISIDQTDLTSPIPIQRWQVLAANKINPFKNYRFRRLNAERDIIPESASTGIAVDKNGNGATRTIHHFLTHSSRDKAVVDQTILNDLNAIFGQEAHFTRIETRDDGGTWEIWLDEKQKGRVRLSRSGSGLKTIILVLAYLHLLPLLEGSDSAKYLYGFEELENNLHPALQRRLLRFLRDFSARVGCHFFLTTHSPVEIDYFARDEHAQVLHVTHDQMNARVTTVSAYAHGRHVLDDLDIRASDILQSNGVIWVEGPSDRIYLNRWIELWSDGELRDGAHYQVLQYGGALIAHLDAEAPNPNSETIHVLTTNRNVAILIDSDKTDELAALKVTPQRIIEELQRNDGISWVTAGRAIENYIPTSLYISAIGEAPSQYEDAIEFIKNHNQHATTKLTTDKVALARRLTPQLDKEQLIATLDLPEKLDELCTRIRRWNGI